MSLHDLKKELVSLIENTDNEKLLSLLKEDFIFYGKTKESDVTDELSDEQLNDLKILAEEDETKETMGLDEFKAATSQWRMK
ncbi:MAG: hypothetical protein JWR72_1008 [Flavisolibacter sp.]|jgi:hypothetical protein|nr:hypothetical protein [Flavisolibacter sp.]